MKYVDLRKFDEVEAALNFEDENGLPIEGGCDLFTLKATHAEKKLEKEIHEELEAKHLQSLRTAASLSPPAKQYYAQSNKEDLTRETAFGSFSHKSNRRVFIHLIQTLNASHGDYDFSCNPNPADFRVVPHIDALVDIFAKKLLGARGISQNGLETSDGGILWGMQMWRHIDREMDFENCTIYTWLPEENPIDVDDPVAWSMYYFFYNKERKRVTYLYARAPTSVAVWSHSKRRHSDSDLEENNWHKKRRYEYEEDVEVEEDFYDDILESIEM